MVVRVTCTGTGEWRSLSQHDEQDNGCSEEINRLTSVWFSKMDLWSHVAVGAELSVKHARLIVALSGSSETKVSNFEVELVIKHDVFWLQITVAYPSSVHVAQSIDQLRKEGPASLLRKPT